MPNNMIKHDVKEGKGSKESLEKKWDKAGDAAKKSHPDNKYALQNYIYEKMRDSKSHKSEGAVKLHAAERLAEGLKLDA